MSLKWEEFMLELLKLLIMITNILSSWKTMETYQLCSNGKKKLNRIELLLDLNLQEELFLQNQKFRFTSQQLYMLVETLMNYSFAILMIWKYP